MSKIGLLCFLVFPWLVHSLGYCLVVLVFVCLFVFSMLALLAVLVWGKNRWGGYTDWFLFVFSMLGSLAVLVYGKNHRGGTRIGFCFVFSMLESLAVLV